MRTLISKDGKTIADYPGFYPMDKGDTIFIDGVWYRVKEKSLHFPVQRLVITVE